MKKPNFDRQIEVIMASFDFKRVRMAMIALDWQWSVPNKLNEREIPSLSRIKKAAKSLLKDLSSGKFGDVDSVGSGGFIATMTEYGDLGLSFVLESGHYMYAENGDTDYFG